MMRYKKYGVMGMFLTCAVQIIAMEESPQVMLYNNDSMFFVQPLPYYENGASYMADLRYAELEFSKNKLLFPDFAQQKKEFWKEKKSFLNMYKNKDFSGFLSGIFLYNPGAHAENIPKIGKMIEHVHSDCSLTEEEKWPYLDLLYAQYQCIQTISVIVEKENDQLKRSAETILADQRPLKRRRTKRLLP